MQADAKTILPEHLFPVGTPVCITTKTWRRDRATQARTIGTVEAWEELPTGSWHAHGKNDRLWLRRVRLRKLDGEISLLVMDDSTGIARIEAAKSDS